MQLDKGGARAQASRMPPARRWVETLLGTAVFSLLAAIAAPGAWAAPDVAAGKARFEGICVQCHRTDASGVPGMGMDLRTAPLVKSGSLDAIAKFIATGHTPTKEFSLGMPPNGGESLSQAERLNIAAYLKTLTK